MLDRITVKVSELFEVADLLRSDKMAYISLQINEADNEDAEYPVPACVSFLATNILKDITSDFGALYACEDFTL